jgi:hypothetical protein
LSPRRSLPPSDRFGPWADGLTPAELLARLRSMRAIAGLLCGPRAKHLCSLLAAAEFDPGALAPALVALVGLAPLDRRHVLASYAKLDAHG